MALNILKDKRETIILKEEVKNLMPKQKEGSKKEESDDGTKTFLLQNLKRFQEELSRAFHMQRNHHLFLQSQLEYLKNENLETATKVLSLQKRIEELEAQVGHKKKMMMKKNELHLSAAIKP
jgi:hypothetical protein